MLRLFIDEFGHHDMKSSDLPNERYLGLTGVIMRLTVAQGAFTQGLNEIKQIIFGRQDFCLHRKEILHAAPPPFTVLAKAEVREQFDAAILDLIETTSFRVITVIIDKK